MGRFGTAAREDLFGAGGKSGFVRGDADVDFQYVADVIDAAHHAGVQGGVADEGRDVAGE